MSAPFCRQTLSIEGLLREARRVFARIPDSPDNGIALVDHLMAGPALFGLKYPSPLQFDHDCEEATVRANLKALYGIERAPCDTRFRERLDAVDPIRLRPLYTALFRQLQRGKGLEGLAYLDGHYLLSLDGSHFDLEVTSSSTGSRPPRHGTALLVGDGSRDQRRQPHDPDARRPRALEDRARNLQQPQKPRLSLRAQLRSRSPAPQHGAHAPDDDGLS
jgi:hypothetical protein